MNDHITDRLTESLSGQARRVGPSPDLTDGARRRARRIRWHRRIAAGATTLVALAVALPFGLAATDGPDNTRKTEIAPAGTPKPTPSPLPAEPVNVDLDIDEMSKGEPPEIPWYANGVIHDGELEVPIGKLPDEPHEVYFSATAYGYAVTIATDLDWFGNGSDPKYVTRLVTTDGEWTKLDADGRPVVSADGQTLAWGERPSPAREQKPMRLTTADARTGDVLDQSPVVASAEQVPALGFVGGLVVFSADTEGGGFTGTWDPETDDVSEVEGVQWSDDVTADGTLVGWLSSKSGDCAGALDLGDEQGGSGERWHDCDLSLVKLTSDDRYAVAPIEGRLLDAATGQPLIRIRHPGLGDQVDLNHFQAEPDGDILFRKTQGGMEVLVRCSTEGKCELASEIHNGVYPDPTYALID